MKVKFFGIVQDIVGETEIEYILDNDITVNELQKIIIGKYPKLVEIKKFAFAINECYSTEKSMITNNDIVAIIPPVSGG